MEISEAETDPELQEMTQTTSVDMLAGDVQKELIEGEK
jgi:hypothetical protein